MDLLVPQCWQGIRQSSKQRAEDNYKILQQEAWGNHRDQCEVCLFNTFVNNLGRESKQKNQLPGTCRYFPG